MLRRASWDRPIGAWIHTAGKRDLILLAQPASSHRRLAWPREQSPTRPSRWVGCSPDDSAIDGLVRITNSVPASGEVAHDWFGLWCLALGYFALAVISALAVREDGTCQN